MIPWTIQSVEFSRPEYWSVSPFSRGSSQPKDQTQVSCNFYQLSHKGNPRTLEWVAYPSPEDLPDPEIKTVFPALQADSLPTELLGKPVDVNWIIKKAEPEELIFSNCGT